jgi:hypothetical protein
MSGFELDDSEVARGEALVRSGVHAPARQWTDDEWRYWFEPAPGVVSLDAYKQRRGQS